jgi:hypothetical protein
MIRNIAALTVALAMSGCVSTPSFHLPQLATKSAQAAPTVNSSPVCNASISAELKPMPPVPDGAKMPAVQTAEMGAGFAIYLAWLKSLADWGREGWARLDRAQQDCQKLH